MASLGEATVVLKVDTTEAKATVARLQQKVNAEMDRIEHDAEIRVLMRLLEQSRTFANEAPRMSLRYGKDVYLNRVEWITEELMQLGVHV